MDEKLRPTRGPARGSVILGASIDSSMSRRPGVPMERLPPRSVGSAHWKEPERQTDPGNVLKRSDLDELTPVFGTAAPPRGLSGLLRRLAYKMPEHATSHWLMLMIADRVDVIEHRPAVLLPVALPLLAAGAGLFALRRRQRSWLAGIG